MRCEAFESRLNQLLDQRRVVDTDRELLNHAVHCPACSHTLHLLDVLLDGLAESAPPGLSEDFAFNVVERVQDAREPYASADSRVSRRGKLATNESTRGALPDKASRVSPERQLPRNTSTILNACLAAAALLLVAVLPLGWHRLGPDRETRVPVAPRVDSVSEIASTAPPSRASVNEPTKPWMVQSVARLELAPQQVWERHRQQVDQIADELRPIATSFAAAVTALRRTIPLPRSNAKRPPQAGLNRPDEFKLLG